MRERVRARVRVRVRVRVRDCANELNLLFPTLSAKPRSILRCETEVRRMK